MIWSHWIPVVLSTGCEAHRGLASYFTFYNQGRPHTALDGQTPDMVYFAPLPQREAA
jgi:putative transposase